LGVDGKPWARGAGRRPWWPKWAMGYGRLGARDAAGTGSLYQLAQWGGIDGDDEPLVDGEIENIVNVGCPGNTDCRLVSTTTVRSLFDLAVVGIGSMTSVHAPGGDLFRGFEII
jgi:hypothetical protein